MFLLDKDLSKYTPRKDQVEALDFIKTEFKERGDITKFFMLDLPTGVGKSILALMIMQYYLKSINKDARFDILTNSKLLQEQYTQDFNSISNLWGKNNYQCSNYDCSCDEGKEFNKLNKTKCEECPYDAAREGYLRDRINLSNFHLYTLLTIYNEDMMAQRESNVLIIDECLHPDTLITLSNDNKKRIIDIEVGDLVKTINEENGEIEIKPVIELHKNLNKGEEMYEIEMENGDILKITGNHKVKLTDGTWKKVEDLNTHDEILYINEKMESHEFDGE